MTIAEFDRWARSCLKIDEMAGKDYSLNGLQVGDSTTEIKKIAFAVDGVKAVFDQAAKEGANLLFVHHGLFWGREQALTGVHYHRVASLIKNDVALYAVHLPLDMDMELGNNIGLARRLGLENVEPFGDFRGKKIGCMGSLPQAARPEDLVMRLFGGWTPDVRMLDFGPDEVKTVAMISGGAPDDVAQAIELGADLYITGESKHSVYHLCKEAGINVIYGGHYRTETDGVLSVKKKVENELGLETVYIDIPSGY
ncbi:MAG: Nif3-like dinuclear metal center hexameric protein [Spirochaetales bacterium]|nr:Nif3-like dinuclear metal center hexameric protein [Spirochaetales bacterium]